MQNVDSQEIRNACEGKWSGIFCTLGIDVGTGKHGPCPICSRGEKDNDRFRCDGLMTDGKYFCGQCGPGTGFSLIMKVKGWTFPETILEISKVVGMIQKVDVKQIKTVDPGTALRHLYSISRPISPTDAATKYLRNRGLVLTPNDIRFTSQCFEMSTHKRMNAMLAIVRDQTGEGVSIHRTYLNGIEKADIPSPRKMMSPKKPLKGSAVRLFDPHNAMFESDTLGIAEGIESAMSATQMYSIATWACLSTSLMEAFEPPNNGIKKIVIFADNDANFAGHKAAYSLAHKLYLNDYLVEVRIPRLGDFNDDLLKP